MSCHGFLEYNWQLRNQSRIVRDAAIAAATGGSELLTHAKQIVLLIDDLHEKARQRLADGSRAGGGC